MPRPHVAAAGDAPKHKCLFFCSRIFLAGTFTGGGGGKMAAFGHRQRQRTKIQDFQTTLRQLSPVRQ